MFASQAKAPVKAGMERMGATEGIQLEVEQAMAGTAAIANQEMVATVAGAATAELAMAGTVAMVAIVPAVKEVMGEMVVTVGEVVQGHRMYHA